MNNEHTILTIAEIISDNGAFPNLRLILVGDLVKELQRRDYEEEIISFQMHESEFMGLRLDEVDGIAGQEDNCKELVRLAQNSLNR